MKKADEIMKSEDSSKDDLEYLLETVTLRMEKITFVDDKIHAMVDSENVGEEIEDALKFDDEMTSFIMRTKKFLGMPKNEKKLPGDLSPFMMNPVRSFNTVKLSKIILKEFSGNP